MLFYILRRLVAVAIMLVVISIATFLLFFAAPERPRAADLRQELHAGDHRGQPEGPRL